MTGPIDLGILVAEAAALGGVWWVWWGLPKRQVDRFRISDPKTRADIEDNLRKTIGQLLGGAAVLIGAALAYLHSHSSSKRLGCNSCSSSKRRRSNS
jgi:hypothetical protein